MIVYKNELMKCPDLSIYKAQKWIIHNKRIYKMKYVYILHEYIYFMEHIEMN